MKKILFIIATILFVSCSVSPADHLITLNTDPNVQEKYKAQWLKLTKDINSATAGYKGQADVFGGGAFAMTFLFDKEGNLQNYCPAYGEFPANNFPLHNLIENHPDNKFPNSSFLDEKTAVMFMPATASSKLADSIYLVIISNDTIYRTKNPNGFNHINQWDGKTVDPGNLMILGKKPS